MSDIINRLVELESDVRYQEPPSAEEPEFVHTAGQIPILLSAPHGAVHTRDNRPKEEDEFTAGFARLVAELTDAHVLYARRKSATDPNASSTAPYKDLLAQIVSDTPISFVLSR